MDVSIVIRTKNEAEFIEETLKRVAKQEFSGEYETIIVDSGSTDSTLDIIKKYELRLLQITQEEFSYGRSLNIGARNARGPIIVNLSAHSFPRDKRWLTNLILGFEAGNVAGVYGRQVSIGRINPFEALQNDLFFGKEGIKFHANNEKIWNKIHFSNSNSAISKEVWQEFKFDEEVSYAEDIVWQTEVMEAGFSVVYAPNAAVYHTHRVNLYMAWKNSRDCAYALALMKKKRRSIPLIMVDGGIFLASIPKALLQNVRYILRNNYREYLMIAPLYVVSGWFGWLTGRISYRLKK